MQFSQVATFDKRSKSDLLVIPLLTNKGKIEWPDELPSYTEYEQPILAKDFKGKEGEVALLYPEGRLEPRVLLIGLGETDLLTQEKLRRAYSIVMKSAWRFKVTSLSLLVPEITGISPDNVMRGISEGLLLSNYSFDQLKSEEGKKDKPMPVEKVQFITHFKRALEDANKALVICEGVYMARDLTNDNADSVTPNFLAKVARGLEKGNSQIKTKILEKKQIEKEGMGLLLAVSQGAPHDPQMIIVEYKGNPKSKDKTVLIGKGVTFDTGGLNIKATGSMEMMKCDMSGAAVVLAAIKVASELKLKQNVTAVVPACENAIGPNSYKPGDVYKSLTGKTVEIGNTDAEGRLILADAMAYAVKYLNPTRIVDIATLTGAIEIALGNETTGLFSNDDVLAEALIRAGSTTFERVWRMPLYEEYKEQLRSEFADIRNHGGRPGGSITASIFLQEFIGKKPWAHLDIAGTAYLNESRRYHPRFGTGVGVRLLTEFLENL